MASLTVQTVNVIADEPTPTQFDDSTGGYPFTEYVINNRFFHSPHTHCLGITSPNGFQGQSAAFVQMAATTLIWQADWTACKLGEQPEVPDPTPPSDDWVLLDSCIEPANMAPMADGHTGIYRISGTYWYGRKNPFSTPKQFYEDVFFPRRPDIQDVFPRDVPQSKVQTGLINSNSTGGNFARPVVGS